MASHEETDGLTVDTVAATIQGTEQGVCLTVGVWVDMLRFSMNYDTVLTTGPLNERADWMARFVAAAPTPETYASELFMGRIAENWKILATHTAQTPFADLPTLTDKYAEMTGLLAPPEAWASWNREQRLKLLACIHSFYHTAFLNDNMDLMVTVFKLGGTAPQQLVEQIVEHPGLPAAVIEQHAFSVSREIALRFAAHPNTPHRLRPLITATLPHLSPESALL